ncbi:MAG: deoxyribonuclease IV [Caldilineaceae bacterium]
MSLLKFGAHMSIAGGVSQAVDRASSIGSNAVQIFTKNNRQWSGPPVDETDVARWREELPKQGIDYAVSHASYLINLASPKDELWEKSQRAHADELQRAHVYGVRHVVLHPGARMSSGADGIARIAEALNQFSDKTPDAARYDDAVELMAGQGTVVGRNFTELRRILELVEDKSRVGVCVDTCHALCRRL